MKTLFLPLTLISFTVLCLSILHVENIDTLERTSNTLQEKHEQYRHTNDINKVYQIEEEMTLSELQ